jgi:hypothetical protein
MANPHPKCEICLQRHRPGNCRTEGGGTSPGAAEGIQCQSMPGIIADLARICGDLASLVRKLPCVKRTMAG